MRIRFISDIHAGLNTTYSPTNFVDIMHSKKPADVTLIAGDMDAELAKDVKDNYEYYMSLSEDNNIVICTAKEYLEIVGEDNEI